MPQISSRDHVRLRFVGYVAPSPCRPELRSPNLSYLAPTSEFNCKSFNCKIPPDLCSRWSSVKGIAGNGENFFKFHVLTSQATCFSKARCTT